MAASKSPFVAFGCLHVSGHPPGVGGRVCGPIRRRLHLLLYVVIHYDHVVDLDDASDRYGKAFPLDVHASGNPLLLAHAAKRTAAYQRELLAYKLFEKRTIVPTDRVLKTIRHGLGIELDDRHPCNLAYTSAAASIQRLTRVDPEPRPGQGWQLPCGSGTLVALGRWVTLPSGRGNPQRL